MTSAPHHPPVHGYSGEDPYELIDSAWGTIERWRADALATGELSALTALTEQVRNDAAGIHARLDERERELNTRADAISARELQHAVNVTQFVDFVGKASVLFDRLHKLRADAEEEPLAAPPVEAAPGDGHLSQHIGKSTLPATDAIAGDPSDPNKAPEPPLELEGDTISGTSGDPSEALDQVEFPTSELPTPPVIQQPIAAGLDEEANHGH